MSRHDYSTVQAWQHQLNGLWAICRWSTTTGSCLIWMEEENLGESAALVQILREFFDGRQQNPEIESLRGQLTQLQQRVAVVEAVLSSGGRGGRGRSQMPVMRATLIGDQFIPLTRNFGTFGSMGLAGAIGRAIL
ncbi:hypothetical protein [Laspinema olomoucense]|uniref:hypothetical protein n=1 Tax=Laspinema olomoucense TaxID=3231600 RepID=UPI0021BA6425|nr:hypothetical protein [Laspinema sp. D3a]MCT7991044.1 hypothetical protein [Laspinema sp. D3a]